MKLDMQKTIISKAFRDNKSSFVRDAQMFNWSGTTKVKSKNTGLSYEVEVVLSLKTNARLSEQISTCLLKPEGVRIEDLLIVGLIDPKLDGSIQLKGIPTDKIETSLGKFIKKLNKSGD